MSPQGRSAGRGTRAVRPLTPDRARPRAPARGHGTPSACAFAFAARGRLAHAVVGPRSTGVVSSVGFATTAAVRPAIASLAVSIATNAGSTVSWYAAITWPNSTLIRATRSS